ncbi:FxLYD domain-containing protein [Bailinhaonella thermotolerans]|uniref:Uncharacterized protein n=1 Tax=Bailinhaonella thermotolerans TaxID=1070861 RepID=A0A3A4AWS1_9ACTN|nr:FxLYD domain-containing protein [Bailinhaonella thermotolerans]RJL34385.1 hypothetical protein D5H75_08085 [Bailinhaonella thermotolerans]
MHAFSRTFLLSALIALPACGSQTAAPAPRVTPSAPPGDVTITRCGVASDLRTGEAEGTIVNHGTEPADYIVRVEFLDASGKAVDEGQNSTEDLAPGRRVRFTASGVRAAPSGVRCRVADVGRFPRSATD